MAVFAASSETGLRPSAGQVRQACQVFVNGHLAKVDISPVEDTLVRCRCAF